MAVSRGSKAAVAGATTRVTFEVERFGWVTDDRIEVAGRWFGLRGHRFLRPTLDVEVDGHHRRLLALLEHKPWAADDGDDWVAAFSWQGEPVHVPGAELAVGPDLTIELPAPAGARSPSPKRPAPQAHDLLPAGRPRSHIELDLATARDEAERLAGELERQRATHAARAEELQRRLSAEHEAVASLKEELAAARAAAAARESESASRIEQLSAERDAAVAANSAALAETKRIESERDSALRGRAAVEQERDAAVRARDSARQERNAWMSRARVALAEQSTPAGGTVRRRPAGSPPPPKAEPVPAAGEEPARPGAADPEPRTRAARAATPARTDGDAASSRPAAAAARDSNAAPTRPLASSDGDAAPRRPPGAAPGDGDARRKRRARATRTGADAPRPRATPGDDDLRPTRPARARQGDGDAPPNPARGERASVRTVKIGFDDSPEKSPRSRAGPSEDFATLLLGVPPGRKGPRPTIPLWVSRLVAALALVIALAIAVVLIF
jgi:hypothetical protein